VIGNIAVEATENTMEVVSPSRAPTNNLPLDDQETEQPSESLLGSVLLSGSEADGADNRLGPPTAGMTLT